MTSTKTRTRRLLLPLLGLMLLSSACTVRFNTDVVLGEDDTATLTIVAAVRFDTELPPEASEGMDELNPEDSAAEVQATAEQCGFDPSAVSATEYTEDDFMGVELLLTDIPIDAVNCFLGDDPESPFEEFSLTREGDDYVFNATAPPLGDSLGDMGGALGGQKRQVAQSELEDSLDDFEQGFEDAFGDGPEIEARVSITFPGAVGDNNGDSVDGNTVTWELQLEEATTMMAVGSATPGGGGSSSLLIIIIVAVVVILLLLILFLVLRSRGKSQPSFAGTPGGPPQGGFGGPPGVAPPQGGFAGAPSGAAPPQGGYGSPPGAAPPQGGFGGPPGAAAPPQGGTGAPPPGAAPPPQGGFGGPPGGGQPPPPQPPGQPPQQPPQPPQGQGEGGGGEGGSTRTFRPEDLLPPQDPDKRP